MIRYCRQQFLKFLGIDRLYQMVIETSLPSAPVILFLPPTRLRNQHHAIEMGRGSYLSRHLIPVPSRQADV